jgi:nucleotide-binding universal stress UspA family protein
MDMKLLDESWGLDQMKILVASSGNHDESGDPVGATAAFPWPQGTEIQVLTVAEVVQPAVVGVVPAVMDVAEIQLTADATAKTTASKAAEQLQRHGISAEAITLEGDPEVAITDYARTWGADLIVVGSRDRSRVERFLLGSVSQSVVKHAPCSVLLVKHRAAA